MKVELWQLALLSGVGAAAGVINVRLAAGNAVSGYPGACFSVPGGEASIRRIFTLVLLIFIAKLLRPTG